MKRLMIFTIEAIAAFFRIISGRACRFEPSCSIYAKDAFRQLSFFKASWWTLKRILRCHPFCEGGYDPLPIRKAVK